jgi:hypothetical protein
LIKENVASLLAVTLLTAVAGIASEGQGMFVLSSKNSTTGNDVVVLQFNPTQPPTM